MTTMLTAPTRALLTQLIDYAGLFPPASLSMTEAVAEFDTVRTGAFAWMVGRVIVPVSRLAELLAAVDARGCAPFPISVIVDTGEGDRSWLDAVQARASMLARMRNAEARVRIETLEIPLPPLRSMRDTYDASIGQYAATLAQFGLRDLPAYVEIPRDDRWEPQLPAAMAALARHGLRAKIRCGGTTADLFPTGAQVAAFIGAAVGADVPFKATAGLHHPVRHTDPATGFPMHGFLNLLAATATARTGVEQIALEGIVSDEDPEAFHLDDATFAYRQRPFDAGSIAAMRTAGFVAYGSCSVSEPIADLTSMSMLPA